MSAVVLCNYLIVATMVVEVTLGTVALVAVMMGEAVKLVGVLTMMTLHVRWAAYGGRKS